jgi:hygromycin-B 4-O-kinase
VGHWDKDGTANCATWREHLLTVVEDKPTQRTHGWRRKLEQNSPSGTDSFERGLDKLKNFALTDVPRSLLHCDLMNRNALVDDGRINAVFDWGCGRFGDHLYDLAWFEFWAPWHTNLDVPLLREALENQWIQVGYVPTNLQERLSACYLHIGLDHIAYNSHTENWPVLQETTDRMCELVNM